jgi:hypothetical protein
MVLQIHNTIVLQRVELDGKASSLHFWIFGSWAALMGKHGFAEKLQLRWNWLFVEVEALCVLRRGVNLIVILRLNPGM